MSDRPGSVESAIRGHPRVAIDSSVLIYLLDGHPPRADIAGRVVDAIADGEVEGILATVGLAEVLVGPARDGDGSLFEQAAATIRDLGLRIVSLDAALAEDVAWVRGRTGLPLPDAVHVATARAAGASLFLTNDRRIRSSAGLEIVYIDDLVA